jgi:probable HAF family extracellular repeat protein
MRPAKSTLSAFTFPVFLVVLISLSSVISVDAQDRVGTANLTFTIIDVPGAVATDVYGINTAGDMVGIYSPTNNGPDGGFLLSGGNYSFFAYPGLYETYAWKINDSGVIAGSATNIGGPEVGFLYSGGTFTTIRVPGQPDTTVEGINNAGNLAGGADSGVTAGECFERIGTRFKNITPSPGGFIDCYATGINNLGVVIGSYTSNTTNSFSYKNGKFQTITVPGSEGLTEAWGINDSGIIVGWYEGCTSGCYFHGFVLRNGRYLTLDYPGALDTFALGIGNSGQIVGAYTAADSSTHGFVTSPITAADFGEP